MFRFVVLPDGLWTDVFSALVANKGQKFAVQHMSLKRISTGQFLFTTLMRTRVGCFEFVSHLVGDQLNIRTRGEVELLQHFPAYWFQFAAEASPLFFFLRTRMILQGRLVSHRTTAVPANIHSTLQTRSSEEPPVVFGVADCTSQIVFHENHSTGIMFVEKGEKRVVGGFTFFQFGLHGGRKREAESAERADGGEEKKMVWKMGKGRAKKKEKKEGKNKEGKNQKKKCALRVTCDFVTSALQFQASVGHRLIGIVA
jgi:hypothetical protein